QNKPNDGLYVYCEGNGNLYYTNNLGDKVYNFSLPCQGKPPIYETGVEGTDTVIDLAEWTNDTEDIDYLRGLCAADCNSRKGDKNCFGDWEVQNYQGYPTPDPL